MKKRLDSIGASFELKMLIKIKGQTIKQLAKQIDVEYHSLQKTIDWQRKTHYIRERIANSLQMQYEELWGERARENLRLLIISYIKNNLLEEFEKRIRKILEINHV